MGIFIVFLLVSVLFVYAQAEPALGAPDGTTAPPGGVSPPVPTITINGQEYTIALKKVTFPHIHFEYITYVTPGKPAEQKSIIYFDGQWRRVGTKDGQFVFVDANNNAVAQSSQAEILNLPKPSTIPGISTVEPLHTATKIPENLRLAFQEGNVIKSSRSEAEFEFKNGKLVQTKGAKGDVGDVLVLTPQKLDLLFDTENYGPGKRFTVQPSAQRIEQTKQKLGERVYNQIKNEINWFASSGNDYVLTNKLRTVKVAEKDGITSVTMEIKGADNAISKERSQTVILSGGQEVLTQSYAQKEQGTITLSGRTGSVFVGKDANLNRDSFVYFESAQAQKDKIPLGGVDIKAGAIINTNFQEESQVIVDKDGRRELTGDYYKSGEGSCDSSFKTAGGGCFLPSGGTLVTSAGEHYTMNVEYDSFTGADRELERTELYNPRTGRFEGIREKDGTMVVAVKDSTGRYSGDYRIQTPAGEITTAVQEGSTWRPLTADELQQRITHLETEIQQAQKREDQATVLRLEQEKARLEGEKSREAGNNGEENKRKAIVSEKTENLDEVYSGAQGRLATTQTVLESIYAFTQSVKDYPALTRLFGLPNWQREADRTFAPLLGSNWFPSAICENYYDYDIEPEGFAVIKTVSGTYQAVAGIQMERSATTSPILCQRNPDQAAEEQFICDPKQVCVDEGFCHADGDEDGEADSDEPALGYFYKITWGVTAPRDEAFTPLLDENGIAVSFNVWLDKMPDGEVQTDAPHGVPLYSRLGDITSPIKLNNGAADQDVIIHYSPNLYEEACIKWNQAPSPVRGEIIGDRQVDDVCFQVDVSSIGEVNWQRAGQQAPSVTVQSGEVQRNSGW